MGRYDILRRIERLDPRLEHEEIVRLSCCYDFPWDTTRALEFALFRTFCAPSIATLLDQTGEFTMRARKRYDDTDLIVSYLMEDGYSSETGKRALRRMNQLHGRFDIPNPDYLYVLSTFILEPIRWNRRFGWRPMCRGERQALYHFWHEVGRRMGIRDIPDTLEGVDAYNRGYEARNFRFSEANYRVAAATRSMFRAWFPWLPSALVYPVMYAMMDDPSLDAAGFPHPPDWMRRLVEACLKLRGAVLRFFPPRRRPRRRTEMSRPSYPEGHQIEALGPPPAGRL